MCVSNEFGLLLFYSANLLASFLKHSLFIRRRAGILQGGLNKNIVMEFPEKYKETIIHSKLISILFFKKEYKQARTFLYLFYTNRSACRRFLKLSKRLFGY